MLQIKAELMLPSAAAFFHQPSPEHRRQLWQKASVEAGAAQLQNE